MSRHALSASEFAEYAREQVRTADELLARHRPVSRALCQCGRPVPCSLAEAIRAHKGYYLARLGLAEATVPFPAMAPPRAPSKVGSLRALLDRLKRRYR